jgi:hypothetical protein
MLGFSGSFGLSCSVGSPVSVSAVDFADSDFSATSSDTLVSMALTPQHAYSRDSNERVPCLRSSRSAGTSPIRKPKRLHQQPDAVAETLIRLDGAHVVLAGFSAGGAAMQ